MKYLALLLLISVALLAYFQWLEPPTPEEVPCTVCIVDEFYDQVRMEKGMDWSKELDTGIEGKLTAKVQQIIDAEGSGHTRVKVDENHLDKVVREILVADPEITQKANLLRGVACTFERLYCQSKILSEEEKEARREIIIEEFKKKIYALVDGSGGHTKQPTEPKPEKTVVSPETRTDKARIAPSPSDAPVEKNAATNWLTSSKHYNISLQGYSGKDVGLSGSISMHLGRKGFAVSNSLLSSAFIAKHSAKLWQGDAGTIGRILPTDQLKCICTVRSNLETSSKTMEGRAFNVVSGNTEIGLLVLSSEEYFTVNISKSGAGPAGDATLAMQDYTEKLLGSNEFAQLPLHLCR
ncbi:hypothetical protein QWY85_05540 [Neolewinella lacunae]|uniref:Uncharacterized protein n=1 Tax=Neolewinella lacunae TaxID=1517758 RepID=A0A923PPM6_9BACT|nr:hypothetical protein [Neolewinella lacunae]MBC6995164.1 hypothetical protein [Neolewinella lacunae]MDN3634114.1 hypothetical protein [Neolewinella lacunae]